MIQANRLSGLLKEQRFLHLFMKNSDMINFQFRVSFTYPFSVELLINQTFRQTLCQLRVAQ
jgi:hypothetical protein